MKFSLIKKGNEFLCKELYVYYSTMTGVLAEFDNAFYPFNKIINDDDLQFVIFEDTTKASRWISDQKVKNGYEMVLLSEVV